MSNEAVGRTYGAVIDQVVGASRADFEDNGVSMDVLQELRASWQKNLTALKGARYPWEQQQQQPAGGEKDFEVKPEPLSPGPVEREVDPSESVYGGALTPDNPQLAAARAARQVQRQFSQQGAGKYYPAVHESVAGLMSLASGIPTGSPPMGSAALQLPGGSSSTTTNGGHMGQNDGADDASRIKHEDAGRRKEMHSIPQLDGALEDADEDAINSDLDDPDELGSDADGEGDDEGGSIMLCLYDKVQRTKNKWKCVMKDGILNINGKEYVFSRATGEYECLLVSLVLLVGVVAQQLLDQIHVGQDHPPAAVALQPQLVQRIALAHVLREILQVGLPLVADDLAAGEAAHRDDHVRHEDERGMKRKRGQTQHQVWRAEEGVGRLSAVQAVFSRDEGFVLSAASNRVLVHAVESGQRIQAIDIHGVKAMALMGEEGQVLHCLSRSGFTQVEWKTGQILLRQPLDVSFQQAEFVRHSPMNAFLISQNGPDDGWSLRLAKGSSENVELESILSLKKSYTGFASLDDGLCFALLAKRYLYVGTPAEKPDSKRSFVIRRYKVDEDATAVALSPEHVSVGTKSGKICIFLDIVAKPPNGPPTVRLLHWHANPVRSLAWALDGNYLLSGGEEGVLVFWQIETGNRQFLPRLSGPVDNITVSQSSKKYAIKLRDNALEIISATELESVLRVAGLDVPPYAGALVTAVCEPRDGQILVAASAPNRQSSILQTVDPSTSRLMARTETSYVSHTGKIGHEQPRTSQRIRQLAISSDGEWLAVVDEWEQRGEEKIDIASSLKSGSTEVHLKFWKRQQHSTWDLSTRIEAPHGPNQLLVSIVAFPSQGKEKGTSFVSLGSNGSLKIWSSMDDLQRDSRGLSFVCHRAVDIPRPSLRVFGPGAVAVSGDGSTVAAVLEHTIFLIDSSGLHIHARLALLEAGDARDMFFIGPNLIVGCQKRVVVYDMVSEQVVWQIKVPHALIASNPSHSQFALVYAIKRRSKLLVFDVASPIPIHTVDLATTALSLLYSPKNQEWCAILADGMVVRLTHQRSPQESLVIADGVPNNQALSNTYASQARQPAEIGDVDEGQFTKITSQRLAAMFDRPASNMPDMDALFMEFMTLISPPRITT